MALGTSPLGYLVPNSWLVQQRCSISTFLLTSVKPPRHSWSSNIFPSVWIPPSLDHSWPALQWKSWEEQLWNRNQHLQTQHSPLFSSCKSVITYEESTTCTPLSKAQESCSLGGRRDRTLVCSVFLLHSHPSPIVSHQGHTGFPQSQGYAWDYSYPVLSQYFFFTFLYRDQSNLGWVSQTNEPSRESTVLTIYKRNGRVKQRLHTKSLSCLSAYHFSDSDNSTKIHVASLQGKRMRSELTSHIKNTRDQLGNENYWIYTQIRGVWEELGPKSAAELCVNPALCLSMVLLPSLFYCQPFTQQALKQLNQRFNLAQNFTWRTYWMEGISNITPVTDKKLHI